jgi:CNT family concentrative nucleoside transporter
MAGLLLQLLLALLFLDVPWAARAFLVLNCGVNALQAASDQGMSLVFGYLGGGPPPFAIIHPENLYLLGFRALPMVLVISALSSLFFYLGILQRAVSAIALVLTRTMGVGGALGLGAAAHIFLGMIEAPLLIRPYLATMARGEIFALMTVGMAGIAGTVMAVYAAILGPVLPGALGQIIAASIIATPGGLAIAALMMPFSTVQAISPRAVLTGGAPAGSAMEAVLNEFLAYLTLASEPHGALDPRSVRIMTYGLCGFANFGSVGIMVGGMASMVPERRAEIAVLGLRSLVSGTLATCISGALAGLLGS